MNSFSSLTIQSGFTVGNNFFGYVYTGSTLLRIYNNLLCTVFLISSHGLSLVSGIYITHVICDIGCPVTGASSF
jgi:hypothetical protein